MPIPRLKVIPSLPSLSLQYKIFKIRSSTKLKNKYKKELIHLIHLQINNLIATYEFQTDEVDDVIKYIHCVNSKIMAIFVAKLLNLDAEEFKNISLNQKLDKYGASNY